MVACAHCDLRLPQRRGPARCPRVASIAAKRTAWPARAEGYLDAPNPVTPAGERSRPRRQVTRRATAAPVTVGWDDRRQGRPPRRPTHGVRRLAGLAAFGEEADTWPPKGARHCFDPGWLAAGEESLDSRFATRERSAWRWWLAQDNALASLCTARMRQPARWWGWCWWRLQATGGLLGVLAGAGVLPLLCIGYAVQADHLLAAAALQGAGHVADAGRTVAAGNGCPRSAST